MLNEFVGYYNTRRPHQSLNQQNRPVSRTPPETDRMVARRQALGSIINDYYRQPTALALLAEGVFFIELRFRALEYIIPIL